jgi:hypothetical protein
VESEPPRGAIQVKLKTFISIGQPDPKVQIVNGVYLLTFGFKSELPGKFVHASNQMISSLTFTASDRVTVHIPLLAPASFVLDITPDLSCLGSPLEAGYLSVTKHVLNFEFVDSQEGPTFRYANQKLYADEHSYLIEANRDCLTETLTLDTPCLVCLEAHATRRISNCIHEIICDDCLAGRAVRLHHCPVCNSPATV